MKFKEIKEMSLSELTELAKRTKHDLFVLNNKMKTYAQPVKQHMLAQARQQIARILTRITQIENESKTI